MPGMDSVKTVTGYLCYNVTDLLRVSKILDDAGFSHIMIKPMATDDGRGMIRVANKPQNLRFYDFGLGAVSIEGCLRLDLDADGLVKNFTVVSHGDKVVGHIEQLILGMRCAGLKYIPADALTAEQKTLAAWSQATLTAMECVGPTTLEFLFQDGVPYCADANPGRFGLEHVALQFYESLGVPKLRFLCLVLTPNEDLDVWTLWSRLFDHDNATLNRTAPESGGIFPLEYIRGSSATFMLLAETDERIQQLRGVLETCLNEPVVAKPLEQGQIFDESVRRIWCCGPRPESLIQAQRYNLPYRFMSLVRPKLDLVVVPAGLTVGVEFSKFCADVVGIEESQIIYTKGESYCMDDDMDEEVIAKLKAVITTSAPDKFMFVP